MKEAKSKIKLVRPDLTDVQIESYLLEKFKKNFKNPPCVIDNNYTNKSFNTDLAGLYSWIENTKPIIGGFGVLYKNQKKSVNNIARMIYKFLLSRTEIKNRMKLNLEKYGPDSYEYKQDDRLQGAEKVNANACYGAGGAKVSFSYNLYAAASTTATAQSLISTACAAFESFMSNNTKFYDLDEIITFIHNIKSEERKLSLDGIKLVGKNKVLNKLIDTCFKPKKIDKELLSNILDNLSVEDLTRIYYKNNLFEFTMNCEEVYYRLKKIMRETESFRAPEKKFMTEELESDLKIIWKYYSEFVHYKHPVYNRIFRLKTDVRKSVLVIDTDSNMLIIKKWIQMILTEFVDRSVEREEEENIYTATSIIGVFITNMIQDTLNQYCENANVLKEYWKNINMKNEFFYELLITTDVKKNYIGKMLLREGKPMNGKIDIKGLSFVKSGISEEIGNTMKSIIQEHIVGDSIDVRNVIISLNALSNLIRRSLKSGDPTFTKPMAVNTFEMYKDPLSEMGVRAVIVYNAVYKDDPIELPDHIRSIKVKMEKKKDIEILMETNPDIYNALCKEIYDSDNERISKGITSIAIPQTMEKIPEWIIQFIDIETIIEDNVKSFFPVLKSLGLDIINTRATNKMYSNIVNF
jgi:hypothetical protein